MGGRGAFCGPMRDALHHMQNLGMHSAASLPAANRPGGSAPHAFVPSLARRGGAPPSLGVLCRVD